MFEEAQMYDAHVWPQDWRRRYSSYFSRLMQQGEAAFFLALDADRIVGTAGGSVRDGYPTAILNRRVGYIFNVRVDPTTQLLYVASTVKLTQPDNYNVVPYRNVLSKLLVKTDYFF